MKNRSISPDELCALIEEHFSTLLLFARRWNLNEAEDLVQDAFLQLIKRSLYEERPAHLLAWLFQVVRNGAIDRTRRKKTSQVYETTLKDQREPMFTLPSDALIRAEEIAALLARLSPEQHEIVVARIWGSLTFDQIAAMLEVPRTSVYRQYTEALRTMREHGQQETSS